MHGGYPGNLNSPNGPSYHLKHHFQLNPKENPTHIIYSPIVGSAKLNILESTPNFQNIFFTLEDLAEGLLAVAPSFTKPYFYCICCIFPKDW